MSSPPFVVVSDFDGTITTSDLVVALTTRVNESNRLTVDRINRKELDLRPGLEELFSRLPSRDKKLYEEYLRHLATFRSGYHRFDTVLRESGIPFYIVSNGLDFMLDAVLGIEPVGESRRISNRAVFDGSAITIDWQHPCHKPCPGGCGLCKFDVVGEIKDRYAIPVIYIGDGVTDINGAKRADRVYARAWLAHWLDVDQVPYTPFETFDDILQDLFSVEEVVPGE